LIETGTIVNMGFASERRLARLHSPLKKFRIDEQVVEHRRDPSRPKKHCVEGQAGIREEIPPDRRSIAPPDRTTDSGRLPVLPREGREVYAKIPGGIGAGRHDPR